MVLRSRARSRTCTPTWPRVAECLERFANTVLGMYPKELPHTIRAVDLRKRKQKNVRLSDVTGKLYNDCRAKVPFVEMDRTHSDKLVEGRKILEAF